MRRGVWTTAGRQRARRNALRLVALLVRFYNPIAALPSQHLSLTVVTGSALAARARGRPARAAAHLYPLAVGVVVVATGNHYVLDVAAGAALGDLARRIA